MFRGTKVSICKTIDFTKKGEFFTIEPGRPVEQINLSLEDIMWELEQLSDCTKQEIITRLKP